jgi:hypothetical protein
MLSAEENDDIDENGSGHAHGRTAQAILVAGSASR